VVIIWSKPAREDLRLIHQYIAHDSKRYATRVVQDITEKVEVLRELPKLGRKNTSGSSTSGSASTSAPRGQAPRGRHLGVGTSGSHPAPRGHI
jgi:plasmid stabilization system protein ParE